jgi:5-formyltetrahydrofolate cyclo-ligase
VSTLPSPPADAPKRAWRTWAKEVRQGLSIEALSGAVVSQLEAWPLYQQAEHVLTYRAFGTEIDLSVLLREGKRFYLTRTWETPDDGLTVHEATEGLEQHRFGYWQPLATARVVEPRTIDLVLVPGLAFDRTGARLGYGMGHYDRLLPLLKPGVVRAGVTADALVVPHLPAQAFDVPMTHLVTETGVLACEAGTRE